jgi:hypothetical protein
MIKYMIMSWLLGFSSRKLFWKDKNMNIAIKYGFVSLVVLLIIYVILE